MIKTEEFSLFDGRLHLIQPKEGYRVAIDPILLAASVPLSIFKNSKILDMGCGIGTIGFCLNFRFKAKITGIDIQKELIGIANKNNELTNNNIDFIHANIKEYKVNNNDAYDAVVMNPPYMTSGNMSDNDIKRIANFEMKDVAFKDWCLTAYNNLKNGGYLFLIHRSDRLDGLLSELRKTGFGAFILYPIWVREGEKAKRIIIIARKNKKSPFRLLAGLTLHNDSEYTDVADMVIRDGKELGVFL